MNIAEYIEQNIDNKSSNIAVSYRKFAKAVGLEDIRAAKEWIKIDLQELYKCKFIKNNSFGTIQSCVISEMWFSGTVVVIDFSHWSYQLRAVKPHWLSDILKQTKLNNYIVRG